MSLEPPTFEHLDDPHPPELDDDGWRRVRDRSRVLTRRRRLARATTSAAALVVVVTLAAVGWSVAANRRDDRIAAVGTSSSTASTSSTTLDPSVWVTVELEVDHTVVNQGQDVTGTVVFDNHRADSVVLTNPGDADWQVVVGLGTAEPPVIWAPPGNAEDNVPPGVSRVPFRAVTRLPVSCVGNDTVLNCGSPLPAGPAWVWFVTNGTAVHVAFSSPVAITITGRGGPPPQPKPCPVPSRDPSMATGQYCGPLPTRGNGLGPDGVCTGRETVAPCGPGVIPGRYYAYTLPGSCDARIYFDGQRWDATLVPPKAVPDMYVWMRLDRDGTVGFIGPNGSVGFRPNTGQPASNCQT